MPGRRPTYFLNDVAYGDFMGPAQMRMLLTLIAIVYVVGICVELAPTVHARWNSVPVLGLAAILISQVPHAAAWPVRVVRNM